MKYQNLRQILRQQIKKLDFSIFISILTQVRVLYRPPKREKPVIVEIAGFSLFINALRRFAVIQISAQ